MTDLDLGCHLSAITPDTTPAVLRPILRRLRELGYRRAVLAPLDPEATDAAALGAVFSEEGVSPIVMYRLLPGADVSSEDAAERAAGAASLRATVALAAALGADQVNGVPYAPFGKAAAPATDAAFERSARAVGHAADDAATEGITLTFEVLNRYEEAMINTAARAVAYVEAAGSDAIGIHLDTFHMAVEETDMAAAVRLALPRLRYLELGQSGRGDLADGVVDIPALLRDTWATGYRGRMGVEGFSRAVSAPVAADRLAVWRNTYDDGLAFATRAIALVRGALA